jgi:hypothetical protein
VRNFRKNKSANCSITRYQKKAPDSTVEEGDIRLQVKPLKALQKCTMPKKKETEEEDMGEEEEMGMDHETAKMLVNKFERLLKSHTSEHSAIILIIHSPDHYKLTNSTPYYFMAKRSKNFNILAKRRNFSFL